MHEQEAQAKHLAAKKAQLASDTPANRAALVVAAENLAMAQRREMPEEARGLRRAARALVNAIAIERTDSTPEAAAAVKMAEDVFKAAEGGDEKPAKAEKAPKPPKAARQPKAPKEPKPAKEPKAPKPPKMAAEKPAKPAKAAKK